MGCHDLAWNLCRNIVLSSQCHACATGLRTRNLDVKVLQAIFELLQSHYPERLAALWFLNAPFIFWGVWRLVRNLAGCTAHTFERHFLYVDEENAMHES